VRVFGTVIVSAVMEIDVTVETAQPGPTAESSFETGFFFSGLTNYFQRLTTYTKNKSLS
jgi:hypothetical protein